MFGIKLRPLLIATWLVAARKPGWVDPRTTGARQPQ